MQQEEETQQILHLLQKHLQVQEGEPLIRYRAEGLQQLRELLTTQISRMLDHDFERLLQAMYRIDVDEQDFKTVLAGSTPVAPALADLVLERELKKIEIRKKYSKTYQSARIQ